MKYRKKLVTVEAFKYEGDLIERNGCYCIPEWVVKAFEKGDIYYAEPDDNTPPELYIKTLEGIHHVSVGDYIIKGVKDELYPCKPDIFAETYEEVDEDCFVVNAGINFEEVKENAVSGELQFVGTPEKTAKEKFEEIFKEVYPDYEILDIKPINEIVAEISTRNLKTGEEYKGSVKVIK